MFGLLLAAHPVNLLPIPSINQDNVGDWIPTDFGAVKLQETGDLTVVYKDDGKLTHAHIIRMRGEVVFDAPAPHTGSVNMAALEADADYLRLHQRLSHTAY